MASDGAADDNFGGAVTLSGDGQTALVGASSHNTTAGADAGSAYVFVRNGTNWSQQARLAANDAAAYDWLGKDVSLSRDGNTALVGANGDDTTAGAQAGSAYVFTRDGTNWSQQAKLTADKGAANAYFGANVALNDNGRTALVGRVDTPMSPSPENAYVFVRDGSNWTQQARLASADGAQSDNFGGALALSTDGCTALVGASQYDPAAGADAGGAYVFRRSGTAWNQEAKLTASDAAANDRFGNAVAVSDAGDTALVAAFVDDTPRGVNAGSAYVFRIPELDPGFNRLTVENFGGGSVRLTYLGLGGTNYALDRAFDLSPTALWEPQATNPAPADGCLILTNTLDSTPHAFWRMRPAP